MENKKKDPQRLLSDGLHFADAGNALLAKLVDEVLAQTSESKESQLPDWKDFQGGKSFKVERASRWPNK